MSDEDCGEGPPWMRDAMALTWSEIARFVETFSALMRAPRRFCADWFSGRRRALNPLGFIATAFAVTGFVGFFMPQPDAAAHRTALNQIAQAVMPYAYYTAVAIVSHPLVRLFGSRRALGGSIAVALFAGGGPGLVATLSAQLGGMLRTLLFGNGAALLLKIPLWAAVSLALLISVPLIVFFVVLTLGIAGVHAISLGRAFTAVSLSLLILAVALGALHQVTRFGIGVPHVTLWRYGHQIIPDIWF